MSAHTNVASALVCLAACFLLVHSGKLPARQEDPEHAYRRLADQPIYSQADAAERLHKAIYVRSPSSFCLAYAYLLRLVDVYNPSSSHVNESSINQNFVEALVIVTTTDKDSFAAVLGELSKGATVDFINTLKQLEGRKGVESVRDGVWLDVAQCLSVEASHNGRARSFLADENRFATLEKARGADVGVSPSGLPIGTVKNMQARLERVPHSIITAADFRRATDVIDAINARILAGEERLVKARPESEQAFDLNLPAECLAGGNTSLAAPSEPVPELNPTLAPFLEGGESAAEREEAEHLEAASTVEFAASTAATTIIADSQATAELDSTNSVAETTAVALEEPPQPAADPSLSAGKSIPAVVDYDNEAREWQPVLVADEEEKKEKGEKDEKVEKVEEDEKVEKDGRPSHPGEEKEEEEEEDEDEEKEGDETEEEEEQEEELPVSQMAGDLHEREAIKKQMAARAAQLAIMLFMKMRIQSKTGRCSERAPPISVKIARDFLREWYDLHEFTLTDSYVLASQTLAAQLDRTLNSHENQQIVNRVMQAIQQHVTVVSVMDELVGIYKIDANSLAHVQRTLVSWGEKLAEVDALLDLRDIRQEYEGWRVLVDRYLYVHKFVNRDSWW